MAAAGGASIAPPLPDAPSAHASWGVLAEPGPDLSLMFHAHLPKVMAQVHPSMALSPSGAAVLNDLLCDLVTRLVAEASTLVAQSHNIWDPWKWGPADVGSHEVVASRVAAGGGSEELLLDPPAAHGDSPFWVSAANVGSASDRRQQVANESARRTEAEWAAAEQQFLQRGGSSDLDLQAAYGRALSSRDMQTAVCIVFPDELKKYAVSKGCKAGNKASYTKAATCSLSKAAGLVISVALLGDLVTRLCGKACSDSCATYLAACVEYVTAEVLELAGNAALDGRKGAVDARCVELAVSNDSGLLALWGGQGSPGEWAKPPSPRTLPGAASLLAQPEAELHYTCGAHLFVTGADPDADAALVEPSSDIGPPYEGDAASVMDLRYDRRKCDGRGHRRILHKNIQGVTDGMIRRLGARAGVSVLHVSAYERVRGQLFAELETIVRDTVTLTIHRYDKASCFADVARALVHLARRRDGSRCLELAGSGVHDALLRHAARCTAAQQGVRVEAVVSEKRPWRDWAAAVAAERSADAAGGGGGGAGAQQQEEQQQPDGAQSDSLTVGDERARAHASHSRAFAATTQSVLLPHTSGRVLPCVLVGCLVGEVLQDWKTDFFFDGASLALLASVVEAGVLRRFREPGSDWTKPEEEEEEDDSEEEDDEDDSEEEDDDSEEGEPGSKRARTDGGAACPPAIERVAAAEAKLAVAEQGAQLLRDELARVQEQLAAATGPAIVDLTAGNDDDGGGDSGGGSGATGGGGGAAQGVPLTTQLVARVKHERDELEEDMQEEGQNCALFIDRLQSKLDGVKKLCAAKGASPDEVKAALSSGQQ
jgi:histone H2A